MTGFRGAKRKGERDYHMSAVAVHLRDDQKAFHPRAKMVGERRIELSGDCAEKRKKKKRPCSTWLTSPL